MISESRLSAFVFPWVCLKSFFFFFFLLFYFIIIRGDYARPPDAVFRSWLSSSCCLPPTNALFTRPLSFPHLSCYLPLLHYLFTYYLLLVSAAVPTLSLLVAPLLFPTLRYFSLPSSAVSLSFFCFFSVRLLKHTTLIAFYSFSVSCHYFCFFLCCFLLLLPFFS